jgi:hypothetical protein
VRQQQYLYQYIFGAVCPKLGTGAAIVAPNVNIETMQKILEEISLHVPKGRHAVVVLDQAGWHVSTRLIIYPFCLYLLMLQSSILKKTSGEFSKTNIFVTEFSKTQSTSLMQPVKLGMNLLNLLKISLLYVQDLGLKFNYLFLRNAIIQKKHLYKGPKSLNKKDVLNLARTCPLQEKREII